MHPLRSFTYCLLLLSVVFGTCYAHEQSSHFKRIQELSFPFQISSGKTLHLIEELTSGELEKRCDEEELEQLTEAFIFLAREAIAPRETEKANALEREIQECWGDKYSRRYPLYPDGLYMLGWALLIEEYAGKTVEELQRAITNFEEQITLSEDKLAHPSSYYPDWDKYNPRLQNALIHYRWPAEIYSYKEKRNILEQMLIKYNAPLHEK